MLGKLSMAYNVIYQLDGRVMMMAMITLFIFAIPCLTLALVPAVVVRVKIIDFGLSKKFMGPMGFMTERVGTIYTMAPQGMFSAMYCINGLADCC
jgi:serine/threonine protein kinase